jgi:hypothetical protein
VIGTSVSGPRSDHTSWYPPPMSVIFGAQAEQAQSGDRLA